MKKGNDAAISISFLGSLLLCMPITAFANSSWHWFTRNPLPMLPWAIIGTLVIEVFIIHRFSHIKARAKTVVMILIGNIISFLSPFIFIGVTPVIFEENANFFSRINSMADKLPFYIVGITFLFLTLVVEIPIVFLGLRGNTNSKKRLFVSIVVANTITTAAVALMERIIYKGSW